MILLMCDRQRCAHSHDAPLTPSQGVAPQCCINDLTSATTDGLSSALTFLLSSLM